MEALGAQRGVLGFGGDRVVHHVLSGLPNSWKKRSFGWAGYALAKAS